MKFKCFGNIFGDIFRVYTIKIFTISQIQLTVLNLQTPSLRVYALHSTIIAPCKHMLKAANAHSGLDMFICSLLL